VETILIRSSPVPDVKGDSERSDFTQHIAMCRYYLPTWKMITHKGDLWILDHILGQWSGLIWILLGQIA
jgi:hypothetical protein